MTTHSPEPGETRPASLARPPSARYAGPVEARPAKADHPSSLLLGMAAGAATAVSMALLRSVLDVGAGLLAAAAFGGWLIGAAVRWGAWRGRPHEPSRRGMVVAGAIAGAAWVAWLVLTFIVAMALLPASSLTLSQRIEGTPFLEVWLLPQFSLLEAGVLALLVLAAAWGAREG